MARFAYGEAIINQVDPTVIFGNTPPPIPFGGSATPIGGGFIQAPGFGAQPGLQAPGSVPNGSSNGQTGQQAPAHYGVLPGQFQPGQQQAPQGPGGFSNPSKGFGNSSYPVAGPQQVSSGAHAQGMPSMQQGQPMMGNGAQQGMNPQNGFAQPGPQFGGPMNAGPTAQQPAYPSNPAGPWQPPTGYNGQ